MQNNLVVNLDAREMFEEDIISNILKNRGVKDVSHFLNPTEEDLLSCEDLYRVDEAAKIVLDGIKNNSKFFIHVDSDNDGISSGAIMYRYLKAQGIESSWYVSQGKQHGTSDELLDRLSKEKPDILIIVDSLDANLDNYKKIKDLGINVIILDHHDINPDLEKDYDKLVCLVSSNRRYKNADLCGAGVTWKFVRYLDSVLGTFDSDDLVDLAASGTLSDMMSMDESHMENRAIVSMGLHNLKNEGIKKIVGGFEFNSKSITFSVAPLVNASCRYFKNDDAFMTFITEDTKELSTHLKVLKKCKTQQESELKTIMPDLLGQAEEQKDNAAIFVTFNQNGGLSGLCGNKLLDVYQRPIFVLKENTCGYSGSCRSVGVNDFRQLCVNTNLIDCAGHPDAFGVINIDYNNYDKFTEKLNNELKNIKLKKDIFIDAEISIEDINQSLVDKVKEIDYLTGENFKPIKFMLKTDTYEVTTMSKGKHLVFNLDGYRKLIKWNSGDLVESYEDKALMCEELTFIGTLEAGYLGRDYSIRMIIDDIL